MNTQVLTRKDRLLGILANLDLYFTSANSVPVERATLKTTEWRELVEEVQNLTLAYDLLDEVSSCFTRDDDLPDELLPRIDALLAPIAPDERP